MSESTTHQRCKIVEESLLFFQGFIQNRCCNRCIIVVYESSLRHRCVRRFSERTPDLIQFNRDY